MDNLVAKITIKEMGYRCKIIFNDIRRGVGSQRRAAPSDRRSVRFVCPRGSRQGRMKEEQRPGPPHLSNTQDMNVATHSVSVITGAIKRWRTPNAKYNVNPRLDK